MDKQKLITSVLVLIIILLLAVIAFGSKAKNKEVMKINNDQNVTGVVITNDKTPIFFYGNTCPHCKDVEDWMKENKIEDNLKIIKKEVYDNRENAQKLSLAAQSCGLDINNIAVPFLYVGNKCYIGTPDIVSYLSQRTGL
jgi:glutaredoxin